MEEEKSYKSWTISDEFWEAIKEYILKRERDPKKRFINVYLGVEEKLEIERNPDFKARRWVVEVCHSWLNRFRKLLVRFEKKAVNYLALVQFACALIVWRKTTHIHQ